MKNIKAILMTALVVIVIGISQAYACRPPGDSSIAPGQSATAPRLADLSLNPPIDIESRPYSKRDLVGRYASFATVTIFDPTTNRTLNGTCIGVVTFDGRGHLTDKEVHSYDGTIVRDEFTGTYTLNADGTGKMHFVGESETYDYDFVISNEGKEITFLVMLEIPGIVSQGTLKKQ